MHLLILETNQREKPLIVFRWEVEYSCLLPLWAKKPSIFRKGLGDLNLPNYVHDFQILKSELIEDFAGV